MTRAPFRYLGGMRIIAGEFGGRRIAAPDVDTTRPMLDRVRESLFGTLGELVTDARVLDLYAGSGSLGLEALSRGAQHVRFVEKFPAALAALRANIAALGVESSVEVVRADALAPASWTQLASAERGKRSKPPAPPDAVPAAAEAPRFDLVFFDPPYKLLDEPVARGKLLLAVDRILDEHLTPSGMFVFHAPAQASERIRLPSGRRGEQRTYGTSLLAYLRTT